MTSKTTINMASIIKMTDSAYYPCFKYIIFHFLKRIENRTITRYHCSVSRLDRCSEMYVGL